MFGGCLKTVAEKVTQEWETNSEGLLSRWEEMQSEANWKEAEGRQEKEKQPSRPSHHMRGEMKEAKTRPLEHFCQPRGLIRQLAKEKMLLTPSKIWLIRIFGHSIVTRPKTLYKIPFFTHICIDYGRKIKSLRRPKTLCH